MQSHIRFLRPYFRGLPLIVVAMVIGVVVARKYLSYAVPMYESAAKLKLADIQEGVPSGNLFKDFDVFVSPNKIATEIEVLKSQTLLNKALDSLDFGVELRRVGRLRSTELYENAPFSVQPMSLTPRGYDRPITMRVLDEETFEIGMQGNALQPGRFGEMVHLPIGDFLICKNDDILAAHPGTQLADQYEFEVLSRARLLAQVGKQLDVVAVDKDVAVIRVSFRSSIPEKAADFVNCLLRTYIQDYIEEKFKTARTTVDFLSQQIDAAAGRLSESQNEIEQFRFDGNIINIHQETETNMRKVAQLKVLQTNVGMNLEGLEQFHQYILSGQDNFLELAPNFEGFSDLLSTEIVKNIKQLQAEKRDLLLVYTPQEERVQVIDKKIQDLKNYLLESINNSKRMLETKYQRLGEDIALAETETVEVPAKERDMADYNREFALVEQSYNFLNGKKIEAEVAQAARIAFHRILSPAVPSLVPVSPNRTIIVIVAALLGMLAAIMGIGLVHAVKGKVNDPETIEQNSPIPVALLTPRLRNAQEALQHFRREVIQLDLKGIAGEQRRIVVVSAQTAGHGASLHAVMLAHAMGLQGRRVLLLDAQGTLAARLGDRQAQMAFVLGGLPAGPERYHPATMQAWLETQLDHYDMVVVYNEHLAQETVGLLLMNIAHANLFVLDARRSPAKLVPEIGLLREEFHLPCLHFVLNRAHYTPSLLHMAWRGARRVLGHRQPSLWS